MSYDLTLLPVSPGRTLEETFDQYVDDCENQRDRPAILDSTSVASAVRTIYPDAERSDVGDSVELNWNSSTLPVQMSIYPDHAGVSLPYWDTERGARQGLSDLLRLCLRLRDQFGLRIFDPQLGRELNPDTDLEEVLAVFGYGTRRLRESTKDVRPWWKFWG